MLVVAVPVLAQEGIFERGNQLYQEGDFAAAADAYEAVLAAGFDSPDLHYNLGNAYFKIGELGPAILAWERALERAPGDADVAANLGLARSLTADVVEPLPRLWLVSVISWWVDLLPRGLLIVTVAGAWLLATGATIARVLARGRKARRRAGWLAIAGGVAVVVLGMNLAVRELGLARPDRAVILAEAVPVRSAPADDDNLTLFEVHEGTVVRIDQRAGEWAEIVLADGKVGWVRADVFGVI
jgi:tetratricopeptide (TPR) repeat protein